MSLLAVSIVATYRVDAQDPATRADLARLTDSLAQVSDAAELLQLERRWIDLARVHRDSAPLHLRLGVLALRLGKLAGKRHYDAAASEFEWAIELRPDWPYPWYGLGLAELALQGSPRALATGVRSMLGRDQATRGVQALLEAVERDPAFVPGLVELARVTLDQRINAKPDEALAALRRGAETAAGKEPDVLLALGRLERRFGAAERARVAFDRYLAAGGDRPIGTLELARATLAAGDSGAEATYYSGAAFDDPVSVAGYRSDLAPIADQHALARFDSTRGGERVEFLRRFWVERDRLELRAPGDRLREHYRRLDHAQRNYRLALTQRRFDVDEPFRAQHANLDDRGVIYVRHGTPSDEATLVGGGVCGNVSWRYDLADGPMVFHFVARDDPDDFRLVESVYDVLGAGGRRRLRDESCTGGPVDELLLSRSKLAPRYGKLIGAGPARRFQLEQEERIAGERSIEIGTTTDSYELRFTDEVEAGIDAVAVGTRGGEPLVHGIIAVRAGDLEAEERDGRWIYRMRVRMVVAADSTPVATLDTMVAAAYSRKPGKSDYVMARVELPARPGALRWRAAVSQDSARGLAAPWDSVRVTLSTGELALSDLVLGDRRASAMWVPAPGDTAFMTPEATFRRGTPVELYYEVYGLEPSATYRTELHVVRQRGDAAPALFGGGKPAIRLSFSDRARGTDAERVTRVRRTLDVERLGKGVYWLDLRVTDAAGGSDVRRRRLVIQ